MPAKTYEVNPRFFQELSTPPVINFLNYLFANNESRIWLTGEHLMVNPDSEDHYYFINMMLSRIKIVNERRMCCLYFINPEPLEKGSYGQVYPIDRLYTLDHDLQFIQTGTAQKELVVKIMDNISGGVARMRRDVVKLVTREYEASQITEHLAVEVPWVNRQVADEKRGNYPSCLVMNKMPGKRLWEVIDNFSACFTTPQERFELTLELLRTFKRQVTTKKLIHGSINPGNIMVEYDGTGKIEVNFINFTQSIKPLYPFNTRTVEGRSRFMPFELLISQTILPSQAIDVFSLARVILLIWGDQDQALQEFYDPSQSLEELMIQAKKYLNSYRTAWFEEQVTSRNTAQIATHDVLKAQLCKELECAQYLAYYKTIAFRELQSLFTRVHGLKDEEKNAIRLILKGMLVYDPYDRIHAHVDVSQAIFMFTRVSNYCLGKTARLPTEAQIFLRKPTDSTYARFFQQDLRGETEDYIEAVYHSTKV